MGVYIMSHGRSVPLKNIHEELGASFGEFAGWEVPMMYTSTIEEHLAVRNNAGVFDISHMGRVVVRGPDAIELLERLYTKKISKTKPMFMSGPTLALNEYARVKDDEMFYRVSDEEWLFVPNAAVTKTMINYLKSKAEEYGLRVEVEDLTEKYAMLALQGPKAVEYLSRIASSEVVDLKPLEFVLGASIAGVNTFLVSRSGWTGEDGFEIWAEPSKAGKILRELVGLGVKPVGIAARDTLRIEMGFVLGGHEYGEDPLKYPCALSLRYGLGAIDWDKTGFVGEPALRACRKEGVRWIRIGFVMKKKYARFIPREGYTITVEGVDVGWVTSGTYSPIRKRGLGMGYIDVRYAILDEPITIVDHRGREGIAKIQEFPLIHK